MASRKGAVRKLRVDAELGTAEFQEQMTHFADALGGQVAKINKTLSMGMAAGGWAVALVGGFKVVQGAAQIASDAVTSLTSTVVKLSQEGNRLSGIASSFEGLGGSVAAIENARDATLGLVTSFDLMREANRGMMAGLPDINANLSTIAQWGRAIADSFGGDTQEAISAVMSALSSGKGMRGVGLVVDAEGKSKLQVYGEAVAYMREQLANLEPAADSAGAAFQSFSNSLEDMRAGVAIGVNGSVALTAAWRGFEETIDGIDTRPLGRMLGELTAIVVGLAAAVSDVAAKFLENDLLSAERQMFARETELMERIARIRQQANEDAFAQSPFLPSFLEPYLGGGMKVKDVKAGALADAEGELERMRVGIALIRAEKNAADEKREADEKAQMDRSVARALEFQKRIAEAMASVGSAAAGKKALDEWNRNLEQIEGRVRDLRSEAVKPAIETAIEDFNESAFRQAIEAYRTTLSAGITEELNAKFGKVWPEQAREFHDLMVEDGLEPFYDRWEERGRQVNEDLAKDWQKRHEAAAGFFADILSAALDGDGNLGDVLMRRIKGVAVDLGSNIMTSVADRVGLGDLAATLGGYKPAGSPTPMSGYAGQAMNWIGSLFGGSGGTAGGSAAAGSAYNLGAAYAEGMQDALGYTAEDIALQQGAAQSQQAGGALGMSAGAMGAWAGALAAVVGIMRSAANAQDKKKEVGRTLTEEEIKAAFDPAVELGYAENSTAVMDFGYKYDPALREFIGFIVSNWSGSNDLNTLQRRAARSRVSDTTNLDEDMTFQPMTGGGPIRGVHVPYPLDHSNPRVGEAYPLMTALGDVYGGGGKPGEDMASIFTNMIVPGAQDFVDVMINAQALIQQMGVDLGEVKDQLLTLYLDGKIALDRFGAGLQGLNQIEVGDIPGIGNTDAALRAMAQNLNNPRQELESLRLLWNEAQEAGITSMSALADFMQNRLGPEAGAAFRELEALGITSFENVSELTADQVYAVMARLDQLREEFKTATGVDADAQQPLLSDENQQLLKAAGEDADALREALEAIPAERRVVINIEARGDTAALEALSGGSSSSGGGGAVADDGPVPPGSAYGDAFAFARGGVVTGRTPFSFSGRRLGIMGEAGPEAILPLRRVNGKLGVSAIGEGGGGVIAPTFVINAQGAPAGTEGRWLAALQAYKQQAVAEAVTIMSRRR